MKRQWICVGMLALVMAVLAGCVSKDYLVSTTEYRSKVRTLGVVPLLVDTNSTILHPERSAVIQILRENNREKHAYLIQKLKKKEDYFDVRQVAGDPAELFSALVSGSTPAVKKNDFYRGYQFNAAAVGEVCQRNAVDSLLIVALGGAQVPMTHWDRTRLGYLTTGYNVILASAAVVSRDGKLMWEYNSSPKEPFLELQYPDFDEAHYNKTNDVRLKFVSLDGLKRMLEKTPTSLLNASVIPEVYEKLLDDVADHMKLGW